MTESSNPTVRYATLRDYLRVLRRYLILIVAITIVGGVAGYVYAKGQSASYKATAEVNFQDPLQGLGIVGLAANQPLTPAQLASVAADLVTGPTVMNQVKAEMGSAAPAQALADEITPQVVVPSELLAITATSTNPAFSTKLANTTASVLTSQDNAQAQAQFVRLAAVVQKRISTLTAHRGTNATNNSELVFYEDELGRLQTLSSFAKTAELARPAVTPSASSATSTSRSALLGLIFGLLLGIAAAFLRDSLDRRLRDSKDVQTSFGLPVLGHVRHQAMGRIVHTSDRSRRNGQVDIEAFRIVRRNLELLNPETPPKTIVVTSAVADEGKTTVAGSLAFSLASTGRRTLLIECDLRRPTLATRLGVEQVPGLTDYLGGSATPQEVLRTVEFAQSSSTNGNGNGNGHHTDGAVHQVVCIPSGSRTSRAAELIGSARFRDFLAQVSESYDAIILDSAPLLPVSDTLEILPYIDAVVLCVRESQTTRGQASAAKAALKRCPGRRVGVVVTGVRARGADDEVVYAHSYEYA